MALYCLSAVIVGDTNTPDEQHENLAKKDNVFFLSASYQKENFMGSAFVRMMPFKSFARKNIGYLFAVNHGAKTIFDFDDDNILMPLEDGETIPPPFRYDDLKFERTMLLKFIKEDYSETRTPLAFNPYVYMGASHSFSWPRGFPIDKLQYNFEEWDKANASVEQVGDMHLSLVGVIQSLCNGDPDNDAVFCMTRQHSTNFTFDKTKSAIPLLLPSKRYSPYNAQATTHFYNAFWGLYLPITVPGRVTDIWRAYVSQRIMKEANLHVVYTPPIVIHERSAHDYLSDMIAEIPLYDKTERLLEYLEGWSSNAESLPQFIFDLWVGLYEHNYIEKHDVHAVFEWLKCMEDIGYKFPEIKSRRPTLLSTFPQKQPDLDGQPYRAFPAFSNMSAVGGLGEEQAISGRPEIAVLKLIMMTMNEWPLLKSWLLYHGQLIGFENLYIIDGSTDPRCVSFLRYARDILGANVLFSNANLNGLTDLMTRLASNIRGSSDFIMKVDTDEFLGVYNNSTALSVNVMEYLAGFAMNKDHPLRQLQGRGHSRVGYLQGSVPTRRICEDCIYATPDRFPLAKVHDVRVIHFNWYKAVYDSRSPVTLNLGGHAGDGGFTSSTTVTHFGIVHYHSRCVEIEVENCKRVLQRHNYIGTTGSQEEIRNQLVKLCNIQPEQNFCDTECRFRGASYHKAAFYAKWLDCEDVMKKNYYEGDSTGQNNTRIANAIKMSTDKFIP